MIFRTSDGYTLFPVNGEWVDSPDPEKVDLTFRAGPDGLPVDDLGTPLEGKMATTTLDRKQLTALANELRDLCLGRWGPTREQLLDVIQKALEAGSVEPLRQIDPEARWGVVSAQLEELPIHTDDMPDERRWYYFVLSGGEWWPCTGGEEVKHPVYGPVLNYRIDYDNGECESGPAMPGHWAHCSADHNPCIPYKYDLE